MILILFWIGIRVFVICLIVLMNLFFLLDLFGFIDWAVLVNCFFDWFEVVLESKDLVDCNIHTLFMLIWFTFSDVAVIKSLFTMNLFPTLITIYDGSGFSVWISMRKLQFMTFWTLIFSITYCSFDL